ncbi:hypothetical protein, partial [Bradyrhizobium liaoningense]|uniref:hypothetical protein n=1 Tax=Bradyrhizobium liaoningense TaxID=43992 RepID=UPI001BA75435
MHALDQAEQVSDGRLFVCHDRSQEARLLDGLVIVAPGNIGTHALLPRLQDDNADHASLGALLLNDRVQLPLDRVEFERHNAAGLGPDLQVVLGEILKVAVKPLGMIQHAADCVRPVRHRIHQ